MEYKELGISYIMENYCRVRRNSKIPTRATEKIINKVKIKLSETM